MTSDPKFTPGPWTVDESGCIMHRPKGDVFRSMLPPDFSFAFLKIRSPWREDAWEDDKTFKKIDGKKFEVTDEDLRYVDESTLNIVAFHENPEFITGLEHKLSTELGGVQDWSLSVTDSNGNVVVREVRNSNPPGENRIFYKRK